MLFLVKELCKFSKATSSVLKLIGQFNLDVESNHVLLLCSAGGFEVRVGFCRCLELCQV